MKWIERVATKAVIIIAVVLLAGDVALGVATSERVRSHVRDMINMRMLDVCNTAAAMLDGDAVKNLAVGEEDTPEYQGIYDVMKLFRDTVEPEYIYVMRSTGNSTFIFLIDIADESPAEFGELVVTTDALKTASLGRPTVDKEAYEDRWGRFYSAYSPVRDSAGRIVGVVGLDYNADWYDAQINRFTGPIMLVTALSVAAGAIAITALALKRHATVVALKALEGEIDALEMELGGRAVAEPLDGEVPQGSDDAANEAEDLQRRLRRMREGHASKK